MIVYLITNILNKKRYVGQTVQSLSNRWKFHLSKASGCIALKRAIQKYSKENFEIKALSYCNSIEEMNHREQYYINLFNTLAPNGYNLTTGGERPEFSEESRQKMSDLKLGKSTWNKGLTKEDPRVMSYIRSGEHHHFFGKPGPMLGRKRTYENIESQKQRMTGSKLSVEHSKAISDGHKKHRILCNENGKIYKSIMDASRSLNVNSGQIHNVLSGKNSHAKGYTFKRILDE